MNGMINLFDRKEQKVLAVLGFLLVLGLASLVFISLGERRGYFRSRTMLAVQLKRFEAIDPVRGKSKSDWQAWEDAKKDIVDVRKSWLYSEQEGIKQLTLDVHKILGEAGIRSTGFQYEYLDLKDANLRRVNVNFQFSGSYPDLKRLMDAVEKFPRFLMIERIDFVNNFDDGNRIELKIVMASYYEKGA